MDKLAQEDHSYRPSRDEFQRYQKQWYLTLNKSGKRCDFRTAITLMNRLHRESGEERPEPIPFKQYQRWHPSSSSSSWWNWDKNWWSSYFSKNCCDGGVNSTPRTSPFSRSQRALVMMCHTTLAQVIVRASSHPCVMRLSDHLFSLRSSLCIHRCLSHFFTSSP